MINEPDYVELGLACADVCRALDRGSNGRRSDELSESVFKAIEQLAGQVQPAVGIVHDPLTAFPTAGPLWGSRR